MAPFCQCSEDTEPVYDNDCPQAVTPRLDVPRCSEKIFSHHLCFRTFTWTTDLCIRSLGDRSLPIPASSLHTKLPKGRKMELCFGPGFLDSSWGSIVEFWSKESALMRLGGITPSDGPFFCRFFCKTFCVFREPNVRVGSQGFFGPCAI